MTYVVDAPLVLARDQEGKVHHVYQGGVIAWLSDEQKQHFLDLKLVHKIGDEPADAPSEPDDGAGDSGSGGDDSGGKPADDATNKVLVAWLVDNAVKEDGSDYTPTELKPLNKAALWELINAVEDEPDGDDTDDEESGGGSVE